MRRLRFPGWVAALTLLAACGEPIAPPAEVVGHRGFPFAAPENTLAGLRAAAAAGADAVEIDVHLTRDGVPVIIHDPHVDRTTDGTGYVHDLTLAELLLLDAGSWKDARYAKERIPTLSQALATCRREGLRVQLDLKDTDRPDTLAAAVAAAIYEHDAAGWTVVVSRARFLVERVKGLVPGVATALILDRPPLPGDLRGSHSALSIDVRALSEKVVGQLRQSGKRIYVYGVEEPRAIEDAFSFADGVLSDRPDLARRVRDALLERSRPDHDTLEKLR